MKTKTSDHPKRRMKLKRSPRVTVSVTNKEITQSMQANSSHCMIADAIKRTIPTATAVSVDLATIRWSDPLKRLRYTYLTPRTAQFAILDFDHGVSPKPFDIKLGGAQVTTMFSRKPGKRHATGDHKLGRKKMLTPKSNSVPDVIGGKPPPTTHLGRRREFGLRGIQWKHPLSDAQDIPEIELSAGK